MYVFINPHMMKPLAILFLLGLPGLLIAQNSTKYEPIDSVGWVLPRISLDDFDYPPSGSVKYLLVLDENGFVKKVRVLSNTLSALDESKIRSQIKGSTLLKKNE